MRLLFNRSSQQDAKFRSIHYATFSARRVHPLPRSPDLKTSPTVSNTFGEAIRRVLPSLPSLTIFEAAARHSSFTRAAEELNLTQSAVSKQIQSLELFLRLRLFERIRQRIVLTEAGQLYLALVREALEILESATMEALAHQGAAAC
ncbi:LysR family transcriptional regulator [Ensifer oleiphilus]|uniref:LysR family transcriptional regulator n=1 Tax=Ensifer oleiphilus TaxID=2742698 RepID=UPI001AEDE4AA|nr:LysR family transcriptional regulator [Ensifer oleiphilus]